MSKGNQPLPDRALTRREFFARLTGAAFPGAGGAGGDDFPDFENHVACDMGDLPGQEPPSPLVVMYMDRYRRTRSLVVTNFTEHVLRKVLGRVKREVSARNRSASAQPPGGGGGGGGRSDKIPAPR
jgi:cytochrome P450